MFRGQRIVCLLLWEGWFILNSWRTARGKRGGKGQVVDNTAVSTTVRKRDIPKVLRPHCGLATN